MEIPLNEFEQIIDETILKRGLTYHKMGAVTNCTEVFSGGYEAKVSGTEEYTVYLKVSKNSIVEHLCDCPYDMGPVCKHIVAVIFYLQQDQLELEVQTSLKPSRSKRKNTKSVAKQIQELLQVVSHEELREFVQEVMAKDKQFKSKFIASFGHLSQEQSKGFYQKQIHAVVRSVKNRKGLGAWSGAKDIALETEAFLGNAELYFENNQFEEVFYISTAILEEITAAIQFVDDSYGYLGYLISSSLELLSKLVQTNLSDVLKEEMINYCISAFNKKLFANWDWHLDMLSIASDLIENEKQANILLKCLESIDTKFEQERAQLLTLQILRRFKGEKETELFVNEHISNHSIRKDEILKAIDSENYDKAIKLAEDGIENDRKKRPGYLLEWYDLLLVIAEARKDVPKIIEYARRQFIDSLYGTKDYYQILKENVDKEEWFAFLEELIKDIESNQRWTGSELLSRIYIEEQWWERLILLIRENVSLGSIEMFETYLVKDYSNELVELYQEAVASFLENNVGRKYYKEACRYMRRMKKLGGSETVNKMITSFRVQYAQRSALMDELNRV